MATAWFGAMRSRALKGNENIIADGIRDRRGDNPEFGYGIGSQLATDPAKIVSIKEVGLAILAKSQHQAWAARFIGTIERKWIASSEIFVLRVEHSPIRRRKIVPLVFTAPQICSDAKHRFAVAPSAGSECISGCKEEPVIDNTQSTE